MDFLIQANRLLFSGLDLLLSPVDNLNRLLGLTLLATLTAAIAVWIFGKVSPQERIRVVRERIWGTLLGIHLFRHDPALILRGGLRILRDTGLYLALSLPPMLLVIPCVAILGVQGYVRYAYKPIKADTPFTVTVRVLQEDDLDRVELHTAGGIEITAPGVRQPSDLAATWRLIAQDPGTLQIGLGGKNESNPIPIPVLDSSGLACAHIENRPTWSSLLCPQHHPDKEPAVWQSLEVSYPQSEYRVGKLEMGWLMWFLVLSLAIGFALQRPLGVAL